MSYLDELNDKQREAVEHTAGPLLIVAGAGTGKTRTLVYRILHLIKSGVAPHNILAVTFTNKAAGEMRERVEDLLREPHAGVKGDATDEGVGGAKRRPRRAFISRNLPFVSTFHTLGVFLLRNHGELIGLPKSFTILDRADSRTLVKEAMENLSIDPKKWEPKNVLSAISKQKGNLVTPSEYAAKHKGHATEIIAAVWRRYEELVTREKACDFDDLLVKTYKLLKEHPEIRERYHKIWHHIHVDEYQDTNAVQYGITKLLVNDMHNICCVGDMDQNIYSWRGADVTNMLKFEKEFPGAAMITLEQNYRSTKTILDAAQEIIRHNNNRIEKTLVTHNTDGASIGLFTGMSGTDEAYWVARKAGELVKRDGVNPNDIAVLFRTNFQSRVLEEAFLKEDVPYMILGTRFFDRKEVKDVLSYLRAARNPDSLSDIKRTINNPKRGLGKASVIKIFAGEASTLSARAAKSYQDYLDVLAQIRIAIKDKRPSEAVKFAVKISGIEAEFKTTGTEESIERLGNIQELVSHATRYDDADDTEAAIDELLEDALLLGEQDNLDSDKARKRPAVKLMTIHGSKGLEFDHVFIVGLEQGLFPSGIMSDDKRDPEEERRLMYVAITRAKKKLFLTHAHFRRIYGEEKVQVPSEFLDDIPDDLVEQEDTPTDEPIKTIYLDF